ncbi:MAG: hypothetical protein AB9873_11500 [Syntrophobacteraceae bacterium]
MSIPDHEAIYRVRKVYRKGNLPKKYQGTFEVSDEGTGQVLATCDLVGHATFSTLVIIDHEARAWQMKPNRKIMPTRWIVTDPEQQVAVQFDLRLRGKLLNPLQKVVLALLSGDGEEMYRLVDPRAGIADRVLGAGPDEWALVEGERLLARMVDLPVTKEPPKGLFGKLKAFLTQADRGIVSAGGRHALSAPVALAMQLLVNEVGARTGE